jgi:hypothetical protein
MNNLIENPLLSLKAKYWNTNQISKEKSKLLFPISNIFYTDKQKLISTALNEHIFHIMPIEKIYSEIYLFEFFKLKSKFSYNDILDYVSYFQDFAGIKMSHELTQQLIWIIICIEENMPKELKLKLNKSGIIEYYIRNKEILFEWLYWAYSLIIILKEINKFSINGKSFPDVLKEIGSVNIKNFSGFISLFYFVFLMYTLNFEWVSIVVLTGVIG